jgi:hypothetical protein
VLDDHGPSELSFVNISLVQGLSNCGTRTTSGTPATVQWFTGLEEKSKYSIKKMFLQQVQLQRKINYAAFNLNT